MNQLEASSKCDVCGLDTPHGHTEFDTLQERFARKSFEARYSNTVTSSWDGDTSTSVPMRINRDLASSYHGVENNRRWYTYINAWYDAWKHFSELQRHASQSDAAVEAPHAFKEMLGVPVRCSHCGELKGHVLHSQSDTGGEVKPQCICAECEDVRKDAARYRWLRSRGAPDRITVETLDINGHGSFFLGGDSLDSAVDQCSAANGGTEHD